MLPWCSQLYLYHVSQAGLCSKSPCTFICVNVTFSLLKNPHVFSDSFTVYLIFKSSEKLVALFRKCAVASWIWTMFFVTLLNITKTRWWALPFIWQQPGKRSFKSENYNYFSYQKIMLNYTVQLRWHRINFDWWQEYLNENLCCKQVKIWSSASLLGINMAVLEQLYYYKPLTLCKQ